MTDDRFDALLASLARSRSRRRTLGALVATLAAATAVSPVAEVAAVCRGRNEKCKRKSECCSEQCRSRTGSKKKRKCQCTPEGERCLEVGDCCKGDVRLFCVHGFCVRER